MFRRLDKFDGPIFVGGVYTWGGAYIQDVNWVKYLGAAYSEGLIYGSVLTRFYIISYFDTDSFIVNIKTEDVYEDYVNDVEKRFETSNYEIERPIPIGKI